MFVLPYLTVLFCVPCGAGHPTRGKAYMCFDPLSLLSTSCRFISTLSYYLTWRTMWGRKICKGLSNTDWEVKAAPRRLLEGILELSSGFCLFSCTNSLFFSYSISVNDISFPNTSLTFVPRVGIKALTNHGTANISTDWEFKSPLLWVPPLTCS